MRRHLILFTIVALFVCSCMKSNPNYKYEELVKNKLEKDAYGIDLKLEFDSSIILKEYTNEELINFWINKELHNKETEKQNIDSLINLYRNVDEIKGRSPEYAFYKWQQQRFIELKNEKATNVAYKILKTGYNYENPLLKERMHIINYFLLNEEKVLATITESEMDQIKNKNKRSEVNEIFSYEFVLFSSNNNN